MAKTIRRYLLAGLVVWLPILITFVVIRFIVDLLDTTISLLPKSYQPETFLGTHIPGLGVIFSLLLLFATGIIATNIFGQHLFSWGEKILDKIPLVRSIYNATKQVTQTIFSSNSQAFRKVLLIEYPRKGVHSLAFLTGNNPMTSPLGEQLITVFVPTTPNPTSGFLLLIPQKDTQEIGMNIDEALKFIISLGVMEPIMNKDKAKNVEVTL